MRIGVHQRAARHQPARLGDRVGDRAVHLVDVLAGEQRHVIVEQAVVADGARNLEPVRLTDFEVLAAMAGRGVDEPGALLDGDVPARQQRNVEVVAPAVERMAADGSREVPAGKGRNLVRPGHAGLGEDLRAQRFGEKHPFAGGGETVVGNLGHFVDRVIDVFAVGDGAVSRDGPGRRRPDHRRGAGKHVMAGTDHREAHMDGGRLVVEILDLGLGERGLLDHRPEHRLGAEIEPAIHQELAELADDLRLGLEGHGGVGVLPVAENAEALELLALHLDPVRGEIAAFAAELDQRHPVLVAALGPVFLLDRPFDGQPVAVPSGHVVGVAPEHLLRAVDDVLEDLVEGVPDMEMAVRVRRPVVEDELFAAPGGFAQPPEEIVALPAFEERGLALRQSRAHPEFGLGQKDGRAVIGRHCGALGSPDSMEARSSRAAWLSLAIWSRSWSSPSNLRSGRIYSTSATRSKRP